MSHADLILNLTKPCLDCGKPRGSKWVTKCPACLELEPPVSTSLEEEWKLQAPVPVADGQLELFQ